MSQGRSSRLCSLVVIVLLLATSACTTVVDGGREAAAKSFSLLEKWQEDAKSIGPSEKKSKVQSKVNLWIEAKANEVEWVAQELFTQVDINPEGNAELAKAVNDLLYSSTNVTINTAVNTGVFIQPILDWLLKTYKEGRKAEGAMVSAELRTYVWP